MIGRRLSLPGGLLLIALVLAGASASARPRIDHLTPGFLRTGRAVTIEVRGDKLRGATLFVREDVEVETLENDRDDRARFRVTTPESSGVGITPIWLLTAEGLSDPHLVFVDDLPPVEGGPSGSTATFAQTGRVKTMAGVKIPLRVESPGALTIEVVARRLGSLLDPYLELRDEQGHLVLSRDDADGRAGDPAIRHEFREAGRYTLWIRDSTFQEFTKRPGEPFHLRVGDFPLEMEGRPLRATPELLEAGRVSWPVGRFGWLQAPGATGTGIFPVDRGDPVALAGPGVRIEGRFTMSPGFTCDVPFEEIGKNERLVVEGLTRSLGSAAELRLRILDPDSKQLAASDPKQADEGRLVVTGGKGRPARLEVLELTGRRGDDRAFLLEVQRGLPDFTASISRVAYHGTPGQDVKIEVNLERGKYEGPVALQAFAGEQELEVSDVTFEKKAKKGTVKVRLPADWKAGTVHPLTLLARATEGPDTRGRVRVSTHPAHGELLKLLPALPLPLRNVIFVGVVKKKD